MKQKTSSPFNNLPADILGRLFGFFDRWMLIDIMQVNKNWCTVAERQLSDELLQYYHTKTPDALKEGYLLNALCDWVESNQYDEGDIFSEERQKSFLQQFKQAALGVASDGSETPLQFITRVSAIFQEGYEHKGDKNDRIIRSEYVKKYLRKTPSQISFLFCTKNIQKFSSLYNCKTHTVQITNNQDKGFLAKFLAYVQDLESFFTTLIFFFDVTSQIPSAQGYSLQRWEDSET